MAEIQELLKIMSTLRDPEKGCPWDKEQTLQSLIPFTLEEAYEVSEAIQSGNNEELCDELGDLLFQIVFYAQITSEQGGFGFNDVVSVICDKLIRRHPHVFGEKKFDSAEEQTANWEELKAQERKKKDHKTSVLDGVSLSLPALSRSQKIQRRAARVGFDWDNIEDVYKKIEEEIQECREEQEGPVERREEEIGDLLFSVVNLARFFDVDAEHALRTSTRKFESRFGKVEDQVSTSGKSWEEHTLEELDQYWNDTKQGKS